MEYGAELVKTKASDLNLRGITKRYGSAPAVHELTIDVEGGTFLSLLGPSGCGKTTTLGVIGGFVNADAGTVTIGGRDITSMPPHRRPVNTVFQGYALFPHLDVFGNVAFGLRMSRMGKRDIEARVRPVLEMVQLGGFEKRKTFELSGGQQQRVALARAVVNQPEVLLLDEPLSALDAQLRKQMQVELKTLQRNLGITFVYVTHDQEEALAMSDLVCVMKAGAIDQLATPSELYQRPSSEFVARFIGRNNFINGLVIRTQDGPVLSISGGQKLRLTEGVPEGRTTLTIRPEHLRICDPQSTETNVLLGKVSSTRYLGDRTEVRVDIEPSLSLIVYVNGQPASVGEGVGVLVSADSCFPLNSA
jgi:spermidine/putrescine transport system ATP-binding protein